MLNLDVYKFRDIQAFNALLSQYNAKGFSSIQNVQKDIQSFLDSKITIPASRPLKKKVILPSNRKCPSCGSTRYRRVVNSENEIIFGCSACRFSEIISNNSEELQNLPNIDIDYNIEVVLVDGKYKKHMKDLVGTSFLDPTYKAEYILEEGKSYFMRQEKPEGTKFYYSDRKFPLPVNVTEDMVVYVADLNGQKEWYLNVTLEELELFGNPFGIHFDYATHHPPGWVTRDFAISLDSDGTVNGYMNVNEKYIADINKEIGEL